LVEGVAQTDLESGNELGEGDEKEVKVEEELELFIEYDGEERECIVFLVSYDVWRESQSQLFWKERVRETHSR
jgi:hypothetical protein